MTSFHITVLKDFMNKFLSSDCFDSFLMAEGSIRTGASYRIDGRRNGEFYAGEDTSSAYDLVSWKEMRPVCFDIIKGKRVPLSFKFVLHLMPEAALSTLNQAAKKDMLTIEPEQLAAFVLTVKYDGAAVTLVTGTALTTFVMDKSADTLWDATMRRFLEKKEIACTE